MNDDDWLAELRQVYERDKAYQQAKEQSRSARVPEETAADLMRRCRAHELMRQVQKVLLNGEGTLQFYENVGGYKQALILMWKGPVSAASKPANIKDVDTSIIVSANDRGIFVNDKKLSEPSPEALKQALLDLAQGFIRSKKG